MRPRTLLVSVVPIAALVVLVYAVLYQEDAVYISYGDGDAIRQDLEAVGIAMSSAITLYNNGGGGVLLVSGR